MSNHKPYYNHVKIDESFCRKVKEIRNKSGMSLKAFGLMIGTSSSTLCRIEKGQASYISIGTLRNLENYCGHSLKPIPETKYPELKERINELEKEVEMLRDYIREMWEKEGDVNNG